MRERTGDDIPRSQFTETMQFFRIVLEGLIVIVSRQIDEIFRTMTIGERLNANTIEEINVQTILSIVDIGLIFGKESSEEENNDSHHFDHLVFEKKLPLGCY